ncbi:unnamed protein product [Hyaloperonospora brassicae]|uniref:Probable pectate lyase F n=1 Tax=Hyaloperonospora brassicae TaxID=162125 RepID=A0AAV0UVS9_HYABA|nr:unnamed protein product [Hyaloperonospora brassicae]
MLSSIASLATSGVLLFVVATATFVPDGSWPTSKGAVKYASPYIVKAGEVFDGKMKTYERSNVKCSGGRGQRDTAVFFVEAGGTLRNAIIGENQKRGVQCNNHDCVVENVWWNDVCEGAVTIHGGTASSVSKVIGGGARYADDMVVQHNGHGKVAIMGFYAEDISKLYRSCGTCGKVTRQVTVTNVYIVNPTNAIVTVNKNWGDRATLRNVHIKPSQNAVARVCQWMQSSVDGRPKMVGHGPLNSLCQYSESDVRINKGTHRIAHVPANSDSSDDVTQSAVQESMEDPNGAKEVATPSLRKTDEQPNVAKIQTPSVKAPASKSGNGNLPATTKSTASVPDGSWPASKGAVLYNAPYVIKAGQVFDGQMKTYERSNVKCSGGEGQKEASVFIVEAGGTLKNAIIGKNQKEGVHCNKHDCKIENVWWDDVCEDAISVKGGTAASVTTITNCGARHADDKIVQHNGHGTVKINGFFAQDFGKLYRSCGTCGNIPRKVTVENLYAINPLVSVVTMNKNYNDQAILKNIHVKSSKSNVKVCEWSQGGSKPSNLGNGPSGKLCQYSTSDVHIDKE